MIPIGTIARKIPILKDIFPEISSSFQYWKYRKDLLKNAKYKDMYKGERCFIIGNGPSLNKHDLAPLKNEHVFTVNGMTISKEFDFLQPEFHIMVDSTRLDEKNEIFLQNMKDLADKKNPPTGIFPVRFKRYFEKYGFDKKLKIIYVYPRKEVRKIDKIDFTKIIPPYQNVINIALYIAIYLGFKKIYLIGCDMTGFVNVYDENENIDFGGHFYEKDNKKELEYMTTLHRQRTNEQLLKGYGKVFELFRLTRDYAHKNQIEIYNATKGGTLDVFPRIKYESLFEK